MAETGDILNWHEDKTVFICCISQLYQFHNTNCLPGISIFEGYIRVYYWAIHNDQLARSV